MTARAVITGLGLVTPLGTGVDKTWAALCEGRSGIKPITRFDASGFATRIAGEVDDFFAGDFLPEKQAKRTERFIAFAVAAATMAVSDARLKIGAANAQRVGVLTGCGLGGLDVIEHCVRTIDEKGPRRVSPFFVPMMIGNMAPGMISIHFGAKGPNASVATACAAGTHAVGEALEIIRKGRADVMITGGVEAVIAPSCIAGFNAMKALSRLNETPEKASRPFDRDRDGFVVGEGAGILILESLEHALKRDARIYAEISGYGMSADAWHVTAPDPEGRGAEMSMRTALLDAGMAPDCIDYINAHGTSTPLNDVVETRAIKAVFGAHAPKLAISSTKSMTGHLLGGAGGIETVFTALTLARGIIPPTINLDNPDQECDLDFVPHKARRQDVNAAMTNSFGFGGTNASLVLQKFQVKNRS